MIFSRSSCFHHIAKSRILVENLSALFVNIYSGKIAAYDTCIIQYVKKITSNCKFFKNIF